MRTKKCICCNEGIISSEEGSFDICPICGWEDDDIQADDPDFAGGANELSLNDYRKEFIMKRANDPSYNWSNEVRRVLKADNKETNMGNYE